MKASTHLKRRLAMAALAVCAALLSMTAATFAWYIYNTSARTTRVEMAAGSSVSLQIANAEEGPYGSSTLMESFTGRLNPVSTDEITGGFQRVTAFETVKNPDTNAYRLVASLFGSGTEAVDYYKTSLYLRTNANNLDIYLSDIGFEDGDEENPISTAMRLGVAVEGREYIFAINESPNPNADDNAAKEPQGGYVLKHDKTDGTTVPFVPYTSANFCRYDSQTGAVSLPDGAVALCTLSGNGHGGYGQSVKVDIYLWLEGCDEDCTLNLAGQTMKNLALNFAGFAGEGA
ncbi:MAG: hypothetical protein SOW84_01310 [Candidatus Faecousia sp.]|nr:hypothetical protein [Candidatus Faecousia sp.]